MLGAGIVAVTAQHWFGANARRIRRALRKTRVTRIADLADGKLACIVGGVKAEGASVQSLMSRKECVAFETVVQVFRRDMALKRIGIEHTVFVRVDVTRKLVPFYIVDESGRARVDGAE